MVDATLAMQIATTPSGCRSFHPAAARGRRSNPRAIFKKFWPWWLSANRKRANFCCIRSRLKQAAKRIIPAAGSLLRRTTPNGSFSHSGCAAKASRSRAQSAGDHGRESRHSEILPRSSAPLKKQTGDGLKEFCRRRLIEQFEFRKCFYCLSARPTC